MERANQRRRRRRRRKANLRSGWRLRLTTVVLSPPTRPGTATPDIRCRTAAPVCKLLVATAVNYVDSTETCSATENPDFEQLRSHFYFPRQSDGF